MATHRLVQALGSIWNRQGKAAMNKMAGGVEHNLVRFANIMERNPGRAAGLLQRAFMTGATPGMMYGAAGGAALSAVGQMESGQFSMGGIVGGAVRGAAFGGVAGGLVGVGRGLNSPRARAAWSRGPGAQGPTPAQISRDAGRARMESLAAVNRAKLNARAASQLGGAPPSAAEIRGQRLLDGHLPVHHNPVMDPMAAAFGGRVPMRPRTAASTAATPRAPRQKNPQMNPAGMFRF